MTLPTREAILKELSAAFGRASNGRAKFDQLDDEMRIIEDVGLASLDILDLRCELENHWGIKIADEELAEMQTIGHIVRVIQGHAD